MRRRMDQSTARTRSDQDLQHHPFRHLATELRKQGRPMPRRATPPPCADADPAPAEAELSDDELFRREMAGVRPLPADARLLVPRPSPNPTMPQVVDADAEVLYELSQLVGGIAPFDITNTTEFIEGAVVGIDRRLVRRLRSGAFAYQDHLDLHGMTASEAKVALDRFLSAANRRGHRCVLIVHGRGRNSKDQIPVLKRRVSAWLAHGPWARLVLAFTSARPCDGGAGAVYVLLRRQRAAKRPIRVTEGAKW
jgi:DNA-nicking Smr family endonuclease